MHLAAERSCSLEVFCAFWAHCDVPKVNRQPHFNLLCSAPKVVLRRTAGWGCDRFPWVMCAWTILQCNSANTRASCCEVDSPIKIPTLMILQSCEGIRVINGIFHNTVNCTVTWPHHLFCLVILMHTRCICTKNLRWICITDNSSKWAMENICSNINLDRLHNCVTEVSGFLSLPDNTWWEECRLHLGGP